MKRSVLYLILFSLILSGCRTRQIGGGAVAERWQSSESAAPVVSADAAPEAEAKGGEDPSVEYMAFSGKGSEGRGDRPATAAEIVSEDARELSDQEISFLEGNLDPDDAGFFVCTYYRPEEIFWGDVFYDGAGIGVRPNEAQRSQISALLGSSASGVTAVYDRDVAAFVQEKTHTSYSNARHPLLWDTLEDGLMFHVNSGRIAQKIDIKSGSVDGDLYRLVYTLSGFEDDEASHEYVMTAEIKDGEWRYISNLASSEVPPQTLLDIAFYRTEMELAPYGVTQSVQIQPGPGTENASWYFALIKAPEGRNVTVRIESRASGFDMEGILFANDVFLASDGSYEGILSGGEAMSVYLPMSDYQTVRVTAFYQTLMGEYVFGSENWLGRIDETGLPLDTYVTGYDRGADEKNPSFSDEEGMAYYLTGDWVYYDPEKNVPSALIRINEFREVRVISLTDDSLLWLSALNPAQEGYGGTIGFAAYDQDTVSKLSKVFGDNTNIGSYEIKVAPGKGEDVMTLTGLGEDRGVLTYLLGGVSQAVASPEEESAEEESADEESGEEGIEETPEEAVPAGADDINEFVLHRYIETAPDVE